MALTRVTGTVISDNALSAALLANGAISARHLGPGAVGLIALAASANAAAVHVDLTSNINSLQSNINTVEGNVDIVSFNAAANSVQATANIGIVSGNSISAIANTIQLLANLNQTSTNVTNIITGTTPFTGQVTMQDDLVITGNLTVNGDQTIVDSTSLTVEDRMIMLNEGGTGSPSADVGILFNRGNQGNAALFYDESALAFTVADTADPPSNTSLSAVTLSNITVGILSATTVKYGGADLNTAITDNAAALQARITANSTFATAVEARRVTNVAVAASNDFITFTRLNANINVVSDNVSASTEMTPFTNVNSALGTSNCFFVGRDITSHANIAVVSLDGVVQGNTEFVYHLSNDTIQFKDVSIPSGTVVTIFSLA
tara:strand:+ start:45660 stop:46790 length:1131 start_codon:yes stop_codon:yes gene_type:complete